MNVYPRQYLEKYEIIEEKYKSWIVPDAKKTRDRRARELRTAGYQVQIDTSHSPFGEDKSIYALTAARERARSVSV